VACQYCGTSVPDSELTCPVCGMSVVLEPALAGRSSNGWEPGPSFEELDKQNLDYEGIPGWLQSFGDSVAGNPQDLPVDTSFAASQTAPLRSESSLPGWLEEPRPAPAGAPVAASLLGDVLASDDSSGFISEDDLPEWLRTISDEAPDDVDLVISSAPSGSNGAFSIPSVAIAWIASHQMVALAPGETLFARIAGEDHAPLTVGVAEATQHIDSPLAAPALEVMQAPTPSTSSRSGMSLLAVVAAVCLIIMLMLVLLVVR